MTAALDAAGGDVRRVQRFSRHRDLRTLVLYDDNRRDEAGEVVTDGRGITSSARGTVSRKKYPPCVYCNTAPGDTRDHVIAKSFFMEPLPDNMRIVRACRGCNTAKEAEENYFRDMTVMDRQLSFIPVADYLRENLVLRSAELWLFTSRYHGCAPCAYIPPTIRKVVFISATSQRARRQWPGRPYPRMGSARDVFLWQGARLPTDLHVGVGRVPAYNVDKQWAEMTEAGAGGLGRLRYRVHSEVLPRHRWHGHTYWMLRYYGGITYTVETFTARGAAVRERKRRSDHPGVTAFPQISIIGNASTLFRPLGMPRTTSTQHLRRRRHISQCNPTAHRGSGGTMIGDGRDGGHGRGIASAEKNVSASVTRSAISAAIRPRSPSAGRHAG